MFRDVRPNSRRAAKIPRVENALNNFQRTNVEREHARIYFRKNFSNIHRISESFPFVSAAWRINQATAKKARRVQSVNFFRVTVSRMKGRAWNGRRWYGVSLIWDAMSCGRTKGEDESPPESRRTNGDIKSLLRPGTRATGVLCTTPSNLFLPVHVSAIPGYIFFVLLCKSPRRSRFFQRFRRLSSIE